MIDPKHIQNVRRRIIADRGYLIFLALFEREDNPGWWDLLIAGGGLRSDTLADYEYVGRILRDELPRNELIRLSKFVLLPDDYEPAQKLARKVQIDDGEPIELEDFRFYQFFIRRALIFQLVPAAVGAERT
jgi:hypothetical protein